MKLPEFLEAIAKDFIDKAKDTASDIGHAAAMDAIIGGYRKFCVQFAKRYIDRGGTDHELLHMFREKFVTMLKLSAITLDELDSCLVGRYVDKYGKVLEVYIDAKQVRKELNKVKKEINHG